MRLSPPFSTLSFLLCLLAFDASAAQKIIGEACTGDTNAADWDTIAQCNGTNFISAPFMLGAVANPPYSSTACDSAKAGMLQYTGGAFQGCNGSSWGTLLTSTATLGSNIILGASTAATNPHANGDATTGLYSAAASTVGIAVGGSSALYVTATGSVGIGTTTPATALDVTGAATTSGDANVGGNLVLSNHIYMENGKSFYAKNSSGTSELFLVPRFTDNITFLNYGSGGLSVRNSSSALTLFMTATNSVGIGTTTPGYPVDVSGAVRASGEFISTSSNGFRIVYGNYGAFLRNDGADTHILLTNSGNQYGTYSSLRPLSINNATGDTVLGGFMHIDYATVVGINTATPSTSYQLYVVGSAYATGGWSGTSDARLKKDIKALSISGLDVVEKLRPVSFLWKKPEGKEMEGEKFGFIAQEVEPILPQVVSTLEDEAKTKGIRYTEIIPVLTKAIQELQAEVQSLQAEVRSLKAGATASPP